MDLILLRQAIPTTLSFDMHLERLSKLEFAHLVGSLLQIDTDLMLPLLINKMTFRCKSGNKLKPLISRK